VVLLYKLLVGSVFWICFPFLLVFVLLTGKHRQGLSERFGLISIEEDIRANGCRIWIQAASIGEVKAAGIIIRQLAEAIPTCDFVLSTMTIHGRDYAREHLPDSITCVLAPLDVPVIVSRVVSKIKPDVYVCLETELWPLVIHTVTKTGGKAVLLNGRISDKSAKGYYRLRSLFKPVMRCFSCIGAIGSIDRERFITLGADPDRVVVTGNLKHDANDKDEHHLVAEELRALLSLNGNVEVFIAGSTHDPEEEMLLPLYRRMNNRHRQVWLFAPRHLNRITKIKEMLDLQDIGYDLFSACKQGHIRTHSLVLVDTFGDLSQLYGIADFVFVGGSFTDYGGHNLMEPAHWEKIVFYGPHTQDFQAAARTLDLAGAGFRVNTPSELEEKIEWFRENRLEYHRACKRAGTAARDQQGAAKIQTGLVLETLEIRGR